MGLDPAEPGLRPAGVPPPERSAGGGGRPARSPSRPARNYSLPPDQPMELFRRGSPTPRALPGSAASGGRSEGPKGLGPQNRQPAELSADEG